MNTTAPATAQTTAIVPQSNRWPKRLMWIAVIITLAWFAPAIIANSPWRDYAINTALGKINGRVVTKSASLWWFSPVNISGVRLDDAAGKPLLDIAEIRTSQSLVSFLLDRSNLGEIRLEKPSVHLTMSEKSSNLQDALLPLLSSSSDSPPPKITIVIDAGAVTMDDETTSKSWEMRDFVANFQSQGGVNNKYTFKAKGMVNAPGGAPGSFESEGELQMGDESQGEVRLVAVKLPLDSGTPWLRRLPDPVRIDGELSGEAIYRWTSGNQHAIALNQVAADTLVITAPKQLGPAQIRLSKLGTQGKIALDSERIVFEEFTLDSSAAKVKATGGADIDLITKTGGIAELGELLREEDLNFKAELDIAEAARAFPELLHIREGMEIKDGKLYIDLVSIAKTDDREWSGGIKTDALTATYEGKPIVWEKPVDLTFSAHKGRDGIIIDELRCDSSFLKVTGSATAHEGRFQATANLASLHAELSKFADLDDMQFRGKMQAQVDWKQSGNDAMQLVTDARIDGFEARVPHQKPWEERELVIQSTVNLKLDGAEISKATSGDISLASGEDRLSIVLLTPVSAPFAKAEFPVRTEVSGKLETWKSRLQNFLPIADWELGGKISMHAEGSVSTEQITWNKARGNAKQLKAFGAGYFIQEPLMELTQSQGQVDFKTGEIVIDELTAAGSNISLLAEKVSVTPAASGMLMTGRIDYEAKLEALQSWTHHPNLPPDLIVQGKAIGMIVGETTEKTSAIDYTVAVTPLQISQAIDPKTIARADVASTRSAPRTSNVLWREPKMESSGHMEFDTTTNQLRLEGVKLRGETLSATLTGRIREFTTRCEADVAGDVEYDADKLSPVIAASTGIDLQLSGKHKEPFAIRGPVLPMLNSFQKDFAIPPGMLQAVAPAASRRSTVITASSFPRDLQADGGIAWSKAQLAGISTGPLQIDAKLRDGLVRIEPLEVRLPAGNLTLNPILDLSARPYLVRFAPGPVIEQAAITPELCRSWLKYVNPLMADVTEAEGIFSLELADSAFPIAMPALGEANGVLTLHQAQVGPGPLSRELIELGKQIEAVLKSRPPGTVRNWLTMPKQDVRFAVQGGRVFHDRVTFQTRDVTITTQGSVGVDQSIQLLAEIPIKDEWVAKEKLLSGLKGQSLQIPIGGTLTQPRVDARAINEIGAKMIGGTIQNKIGEELDKGLQKGLDKLLRPKK